mgnify:CR=1 FL=1
MKSRKINNLLNIKLRKNKIKNNSTRRENFNSNNNKTLKNKQEKCEEENKPILKHFLKTQSGLGDKLMDLWGSATINILLIANGESILNNDFGNKIDQYDYVVRFNDFIIENNESVNGEGGGISIQNSSGSSISRSIIRNNLSRPRGGGLNVGNSNFSISNSLLSKLSKISLYN